MHLFRRKARTRILVFILGLSRSRFLGHDDTHDPSPWTFSRNGSNGSKEAVVLSYSNPKRVRVYRVRVNRDFGFGFELTSDDGRDS